MRQGDKMDRTDAINIAFLGAVVVILVASFIYVNVFWEEPPEEEEEESGETTESCFDIPADIDSSDEAVVSIPASPTYVSATC